ncbi:hypothetical protein [Paenibacillus sp. FSL R5-0914]|uniref:hypothetical protein n=1 Tax=Paenibacillus sp. FSL R5-0914 TaxID=2921665 RepID=UPI0030FA7F7F
MYVIDPVKNVTTAKYNAWGQQDDIEDTYNLKLRKETKYTVAASGVKLIVERTMPH